MGNEGSSKSSFEQNNWRKIGESGNKLILYNDMTMKSVQRHEAVLDCDQGEAISICKWRQSLPQECCIVELYEYGIKRAGMCNSQSDLYVITERIHLFQQIGAIMLRDVASGLKILFKKFGYFNPRPYLIGINNEGRAKVWTNKNFAKSQPQKDSIPIQNSQLGIVNNLIRILESKTYADHNLQIDYPRNLDFSSVVNYVNKVCSDLKGFEVDRVYIDRAQFTKKYNQLRQRQQKQEHSRMVASQAQRRFMQIQALHENLRLQQMQLARKEQQLKMQALAQQQQIFRQQSIQKQLQAQRQMQTQRQIQIQRQSLLSQQQQRILPGEVITDNSQGKLKGTASTNRSDIYGLVNNPSNGNLLNAQNVYPNQYYQNQQNNFRQSSVSPNKLDPQIQYQYQHQEIQPRQYQLTSPRPPLPPKTQQMQQPQTYQQKPKTNQHQQNMKKQIEMVDSMILMQQDQMSDQQNKRYVQSRILTYKF